MNIVWKSKYNYRLIIGIIFILFAGLASATTWHIYLTNPTLMASDQMQFGNSIYKVLNPDLYSRDFIFANDLLNDWYTPTFYQTMIALTRLTEDYVQSLALTQFPTALANLVAAYILYYSVSKSRTIAVIFSLLGFTGFAALNGEWEMVGLEWMLARTYALPPLVISVYWFVKINRDDHTPKKRLQWFIMGFLIGVTTNFHPTTGMTLAIAIGMFALLHTLRYKTPGWQCLILLVIATTIGAIPTIIHIITGSPSSLNTLELTSEDFFQYAEAFEFRLRGYPFQSDFGRGWTNGSEHLQFLVSIPWIILSAISWGITGTNRRNKATLFFFAVQWVYIWLLVDNMTILTFGAIITYTLYKWWKKDDKFIVFLYEFIAVIIFVGLFLQIIARPFWLEFQLWTFTTYVVEFARGLKQIHLPLTILMVLIAKDFWAFIRLEENRTVWLRFLLLPALILGGLTALIGIVGNIIDPIIKSLLANKPQGLTIWRGIIWIGSLTFALLIANDFLHYAMTLDRHDILLLYRPDHLTVLAGVTIAIFVWLLIRNRFTDHEWGEFIALAVGLIIIGSAQFFVITSQDKTRYTDPLMELVDWAKSETENDDLFLFYWNRNRADDNKASSIFRLFSNRSIDFSHKDLNLLAYIQPEALYDGYLRYQHYISAPSNPDTQVLLDIIASDKVDYVIFDKITPPEYEYGFDVIYENDGYIVFKVPDPVS